MQPNKVAREQQIAVFGESGSGKTVLLSCFYGAAQEPKFKQTSLFHVVAEDTKQGLGLHQKFLGMKNSSTRPITTMLSASSYSFLIKRRPTPGVKTKSSKAANDLRLIWHDYPGEWFEQEPNGEAEAQRRIEIFRSLLSSDVALLMVDGQRLVDNAGEEGRYLKALLTNFSNGLLKLKGDILVDGKPLVSFPRIWVMALSKCDLLPDIDVTGFRDLVVEKAGGEIVELSNVLAGFVEAPQALSVGQDFVRLSSARFEPGRIEVAERVGLDLILPIAAVLPFARFVKWALAMKKGGNVAAHLLGTVAPLAALVTKVKLKGPLGAIVNAVGLPLATALANFAIDKIAAINKQAVTNHDYLVAMVSGFELALDAAERERILIRATV